MNEVKYKGEGTRVCGGADILHLGRGNNLPIFKMQSPMPRELKPPVPGHTAGMDKSQNPNPGFPNSKARALGPTSWNCGHT